MYCTCLQYQPAIYFTSFIWKRNVMCVPCMYKSDKWYINIRTIWYNMAPCCLFNYIIFIMKCFLTFDFHITCIVCFVHILHFLFYSSIPFLKLYPPYFLVDQIELIYSKTYRLTIMYIYYLLYDNGLWYYSTQNVNRYVLCKSLLIVALKKNPYFFVLVSLTSLV